MTEEIVEVRDEDGNGFGIIQFEDVYIPLAAKHMLLKEQSLEDKLKQILSIRYQDGDVLLCSYPKSGTHWLFHLMNVMLNIGKENAHNAETAAPVLVDFFPEQSYVHLPSPRILLTHLKPDRFPTELKEKAKMVLIVRNPKDVCVSLYYQLRKLPQIQSEESWTSMLNHFMHGPEIRGTYVDFLLAIQQEIKSNPCFKPYIIYFEDLKKDGVGELRKLQKYLGLNLSDTEIQAALDRCNINRLRDDVNEGRVKTPLVQKDGTSIVFRKGVIGDWKNHFTVAQNEAFDSFWSEKMKDSMFNFQYE